VGTFATRTCDGSRSWSNGLSFYLRLVLLTISDPADSTLCSDYSRLFSARPGLCLIQRRSHPFVSSKTTFCHLWAVPNYFFVTVLWFSWVFSCRSFLLFAFCVPVFGGFDGFRGFFSFSFSFSVSWVRGVSLRESRDKDGCTERQRRYARLLWALNGGALDAG
jgi:hypothetical protein